jgi:hypothetical protein
LNKDINAISETQVPGEEFFAWFCTSAINIAVIAYCKLRLKSPLKTGKADVKNPKMLKEM